MYLSVQAVQNVQTILDDLHCSVKKGPYIKLAVTTVLDGVIPMSDFPYCPYRTKFIWAILLPHGSMNKASWNKND